MEIRRINPNPQVNTGEVVYQSKIPNTEPRHILEEIVWHKEAEVATITPASSRNCSP
jgi:indole-3-glycerol phosphate synthase